MWLLWIRNSYWALFSTSIAHTQVISFSKFLEISGSGSHFAYMYCPLFIFHAQDTLHMPPAKEMTLEDHCQYRYILVYYKMLYRVFHFAKQIVYESSMSCTYKLRGIWKWFYMYIICLFWQKGFSSPPVIK